MPSKLSLFPSRQVALGAAASAYLLYFFGLGRTPLLDPDEPVYGQIAREMVRTGDWLTPHLAGKPWFDKPPLFYWAEAASMAVLGPTELAARLPSALAAILTVLLVLMLGRRYFGRMAGWAGAVVLATALQTIILGRAAVTDMLFTLTLLAAVAGFLRWFETGGRSPGWAALCGAALGLAVLCKGPVSMVLLGAAAFAFLAWERKLHYLSRIDTLVVLAGCALVAGPWYGAMLRLNREAFIHQFIHANNLQRFSQSEHASGASPFFFVPVLALFLFPWTAFLPRALSAARSQWAGRVLLCWIFVVFLFFSASRTKLVTYIYPLYPAAAMLIGMCMAPRRSGGQEPLDPEPSTPQAVAGWPDHRSGPPAVWVTAVFGLALAAGLLILARKQYPTVLFGSAALGLVIFAGSVWGAITTQSGGSPLSAYAVMMTGVAAILAGVVVPQVAPSVSLRELAIWQESTHRPLIGYKLNAPGFLYYSGHELPNESEISGLEARIREAPDLAVAMSRRAFPLVAAASPQYAWRVIWRRGNRVIAEPTRSDPGPRKIGSAVSHGAQPAAAFRVLFRAEYPDLRTAVDRG